MIDVRACLKIYINNYYFSRRTSREQSCLFNLIIAVYDVCATYFCASADCQINHALRTYIHLLMCVCGHISYYNCKSHCIRDYIDIKSYISIKKIWHCAYTMFIFVINHRSSAATLLQNPSSKFLTHKV